MVITLFCDGYYIILLKEETIFGTKCLPLTRQSNVSGGQWTVAFMISITHPFPFWTLSREMWFSSQKNVSITYHRKWHSIFNRPSLIEEHFFFSIRYCVPIVRATKKANDDTRYGHITHNIKTLLIHSNKTIKLILLFTRHRRSNYEINVEIKL